MTNRIAPRCTCYFTKENEYRFSISCPVHGEIAKANGSHRYMPGDCAICGESKDSNKHMRI